MSTTDLGGCNCSRLLLSYLGKLCLAALAHTVKVVHLPQLCLPPLPRIQELQVADEQLRQPISSRNITWAVQFYTHTWQLPASLEWNMGMRLTCSPAAMSSMTLRVNAVPLNTTMQLGWQEWLRREGLEEGGRRELHGGRDGTCCCIQH